MIVDFFLWLNTSVFRRLFHLQESRNANLLKSMEYMASNYCMHFTLLRGGAQTRLSSYKTLNQK